MSALKEELTDYLALRRSMGFKLRRAEKLLVQFVEFCQTMGVEVVTIEVALGWATLPEAASPSWVCHRLGVVRAFSRYLALVDGRSQVIPTNLVPHRPCRATPFLYTAEQVQAMMAAARSRSPVREATFETIIGLLWTTGMRIGEALGLDRSDVDLSHGVLTVRDSKFGKTRELPLHETTTAALAAYAKRRTRGSLPTPLRRSSCPQPEPGCSTATSTSASKISCAALGSRPGRRHAVRGHMISDIASRFGP